MLFKDIFSSTIIMIEQFKNLPIEIINKIMIYLSHDVANILRNNSFIYRSLHNDNDKNYVSFKIYLRNMHLYLYETEMGLDSIKFILQFKKGMNEIFYKNNDADCFFEADENGVYKDGSIKPKVKYLINL
jgi:hypothetical protein